MCFDQHSARTPPGQVTVTAGPRSYGDVCAARFWKDGPAQRARLVAVPSWLALREPAAHVDVDLEVSSPEAHAGLAVPLFAPWIRLGIAIRSPSTVAPIGVAAVAPIAIAIASMRVPIAVAVAVLLIFVTLVVPLLRTLRVVSATLVGVCRGGSQRQCTKASCKDRRDDALHGVFSFRLQVRRRESAQGPRRNLDDMSVGARFLPNPVHGRKDGAYRSTQAIGQLAGPTFETGGDVGLYARAFRKGFRDRFDARPIARSSSARRGESLERTAPVAGRRGELTF